MKMLFALREYTIAGTLLTIGVLASLWVFDNAFFGIPALIAYTLFFGFFLGNFILPREHWFWKIFFGSAALIAAIIVTLSGIYWFYQINNTVISLILFIPLVLSFLFHYFHISLFPPTSFQYPVSSIKLKNALPALLILTVDILLFAVLFIRRTGDTLISPWTLVGPRFFILFAIATTLLLWFLQKSKTTKTNLFLIILHHALILTVALIVFKHGFGFDPIIHQATEQWIAEHGFILPKQPYYIGQYMLVIFLNSLTHLPIALLDNALVPVLSLITVSLITFFSFSRTSRSDNIFPVLALIPLVPLTFFTFTTPNNLALLIATIVFFWMWYEWHETNRTNKTTVFGVILCLVAITIHPFIGLPVLVIYLGSKYVIPSGTRSPRRAESRDPFVSSFKFRVSSFLFPISYFLFLSLLLPLVFFLNSLRLSQPLTLQNPLTHLTPFLRIFAPPHWYMFDNAPILWQLLYSYKLALTPLLVVVIVLGMVACKRNNQQSTINNQQKTRSLITDHRSFYIVTAIALLFSSFLLSTVIKYPDVISYEQNVFSRRILELLLVFSLPFFIIALQRFFVLVRDSRNSKKYPIFNIQYLIFFFLSLALTISWYFTYPTRDPVSLYTGYSIRDADIETVHFIDERNNGVKNYIVLTNQNVASAAVKEFGFAKYFRTTEGFTLSDPDASSGESKGEQYFYSIPTGGPLYQYFRKMVYEEPVKKHMLDAMNYTGVDRAYFVHTNYWAPAAAIRDAAKLEADEWWELASGRVWVYEYLRE